MLTSSSNARSGERLRQVDFKDSDQFFQQFEELTYYTRVCDNKQVMIMQIKKAT